MKSKGVEMEHIQVVKCEKCGKTYEIGWSTEGAGGMLKKVHCVLVCAVCGEAVLSRDMKKFLRECRE